MLPNATDLGTVKSRLADINDRMARHTVRRDSGFMIAIAIPTITALALAYVWTATMVMPAWERVRNETQEISYHGN